MSALVTRDAAKKAIEVGSVDDESPSKELAEARAELARANVQGRKNFFALRQTWSTAIIWWISLLIFFNVALTLAVGTGSLNFDGNEWFITAVTVETFLQVVGLGYVAAKFLFSSGDKSE